MVGGAEPSLAGLNVPKEVREKFAECQEEEEAFGVYPENWNAVVVFLAMQTQWVDGGLNYSSLPIVMKYKGIEDEAQTFEDVQVMELECIRENKKRNSQK